MNMEAVKQEAAIILAEDWKDKIVEHKTPSGQIRKVKVKSLSPEEQKKYKPKEDDYEDLPEYEETIVDPKEIKENADWRKNKIDQMKKEKGESESGGKLKQFKQKIKKKFELGRMHMQQTNTIGQMDELGFQQKEDNTIEWQNPDTGETVKILDKGKKVELDKRIQDEISKHEVDFNKYKLLKEEYNSIDDDIQTLRKVAIVELLMRESRWFNEK